MRIFSCAVLLLSVATFHGVEAEDRSPLTVADAIQSTRIVKSGHGQTWTRDRGGHWRQDTTPFVSVSPDGKRYVAMLVRGDLARNGNWAEIIAGGLGSLKDAQHYRTIAQLFTHSDGDTLSAYSPHNLTLDPIGEERFRWLPDGERVALKWVDERGVLQIFSLNVRTSELVQLTRHPTHVTNWGMGPDGVIVYAAKQSDAEIRQTLGLALDKGFALTPSDTVDVFGLLAGLRTNHQYKNFLSQFILQKDGSRYRSLDTNAGANMLPFQALAFSPDGKYGLTLEPPATIPKYWSEFEHHAVREVLNSPYRTNINFLFGVSQLFLIDLELGRSRPLWDAPTAEGLTRFAWSPDGKSLLVTNTFLPLDRMRTSTPAERSDALAGQATAEVELSSGEIRVLPQAASASSASPYSIAWLSPQEVRLGANGDPASHFFQRQSAQWRAVSKPARVSERAESPRVRIELRQDPNTPPILVAVDTHSRRERLVIDLNPQLRAKFKLATVEEITWADRTGQAWSGRLYRPVNWDSHHRYPLVIQDNGTFVDAQRRMISQDFSLDGTVDGFGVGPGISVFAAQPLANKGIAVLQMTTEPDRAMLGTPQEGEMAVRGYESAIDHLVSAGLVDGKKVGLIGFSRTGYRVLYALTHSSFPYAAALASDNVDFGYWQRLFYVENPEFESINGARPFGDGLLDWLRRAPAFNAEKIHTPLRLQNETGPLSTTLFMGWEMFNRLRILRRPVELYVVPDIERGSHPAQNPTQVYASKQGAVDWFDFWLNNSNEPSEEKREQYERWMFLRTLHEEDMAQLSRSTDAPERNTGSE